MSYNPLPEVHTGDMWSATEHNLYLKDNFAYFAAFHGACVNRHSVQIIPNTQYTDIVYDTEIFDTEGFWVTGSASLFTVALAGYYRLNALVDSGAASSGYREARIFQNGNTISWDTSVGLVVVSTVLAMDVIAHANVGDYFKVKFYQNTGGDLSLGIDYHNQFQIQFLGT